MEAVMPGGLGDLGGGALGGVTEGLIPDMGNPMASPEAEPTAPTLPLGF